MKNQDRRLFLKSSLGAAGALVFSNPLTKAFAATCGITPPQTEGPFYPGENQFHTNNDLTQLPNQLERALGQVIYVRGKILDTTCKPISGANVEIWQACETGRYNHPRDSNPAKLDRNFRFWGETFSDENGEYIFKTIIPGSYPASLDWRRPPHIHFKVARLGFFELTTQMYFKGNTLNEKDYIYQNIPDAERASVVVDFQPSSVGFEEGSLSGDFDITLVSVQKPAS